MVRVNYRICLVKIGYGSRINFMWDNLSKDAFADFTRDKDAKVVDYLEWKNRGLLLDPILFLFFTGLGIRVHDYIFRDLSVFRLMPYI